MIKKLGRESMLIVLAACALAGCASVKINDAASPPPTLGEALKNDLETTLAAKDLGSSFNSWASARIRQDLPADYLADYGQRLYGAIADQLASSATSSANLSQVSQSANLVGLAGVVKPADQAERGKALIERSREYVKQLSAKGMEQLALLYAISHPETLADSGLAGDLVRIAQAVPNQWALRRLGQLGVKGADAAATPKDLDPANALKACVTVWVDRGIKIEKGVGMADRVIGSAFFVERSGYLLTNYHVIASEVDPDYKGYSKLFIRLGSSASERIPAKVVGWDSVFDLALLKTEIPAPALIALSAENGASSGTKVMAFGSPGGLENTVTAGIVSALGRRFLPMGEIMQIDAPVNPGNSGGPLIANNGDFLGIVFAGVSQFQGVNFAVPAYWISALLPQLEQGGKVRHPGLGVELFEFRNEVRVGYVRPGSPAQKLGIEAGAVLTAIDGRPIKSITDAYAVLQGRLPGELARVEWRSAGKDILGVDPASKDRQSLVMLEERPERPLENHVKAGLDLKLLVPLFGMRTTNISTKKDKAELRVEEVIPGSAADENGFSAGDVFTVLAWAYDPKLHAVVMQVNVARRSQGYMEHAIQLGSYTEIQDMI